MHYLCSLFLLFFNNFLPSTYLFYLEFETEETPAFSLRVFAVENTFILFGILCSAFFIGTFVMMWVFQRLKRLVISVSFILTY